MINIRLTEEQRHKLADVLTHSSLMHDRMGWKAKPTGKKSQFGFGGKVIRYEPTKWMSEILEALGVELVYSGERLKVTSYKKSRTQR